MVKGETTIVLIESPRGGNLILNLQHFCYFRSSSDQVIFAHVSDCLEVTPGVFSRHERAIRQAVDQVLSKLVCRLGKLVEQASNKVYFLSHSS